MVLGMSLCLYVLSSRLRADDDEDKDNVGSKQ